MSQEEGNKHIKIFDIAKGFSIILMTLVHYPFIQRKDVYPNLTFLLDNVLMIFVVPIFIFISGYLINDRLNFKTFFFSKIDGLMKPVIGFLLSLTILKIVLYTMTSNVVSLNGILKYVNALLSIVIYGDLGFVNYALWFVAALFLGVLALKGCLEIFNLKKPLNHVLLVLFVLFLLILGNTRITFYYLAYVPVFFTFLIFGYSFKKISIRYFNGVSFFYSKTMIVFPILFLILLLVLNKFKVRTDLDLFEFNFNYHYLLLLSLVGIFSVFFFCRYFEKIPFLNRALVECSRASFFILGFHVFILDVYKYILDLYIYNPLSHFFLFILNIMLCYTIYRIAIQTPFVRILFIPLKKIELIESEIKLLKYKPIYRFIPKVILDLD